MEQIGYIHIHRKILDWEWYTDINTKTLFIHLLLKANFKSKTWRGINIGEGEFITSLQNLSQETGLTLQQVRTSINKLKSTQEITYEGHSNYSLIKLINYNHYQNINTVDNKQITNNQQTNNKQITTTNKDNNINKDNNDNNINNISKDILETSSELVRIDNRKKDIDEFIDKFKQEVYKRKLIYKSGKQERNRVQNILTGKQYGEVCDLANMNRFDFAISILDISTKLEFWKGKIYNAETLYKHYASVYNEARRVKEERQKPKGCFITN